MRRIWLLGAGVLTLGMSGWAGFGPVRAQEEPEAADPAAAEEDLLGEEDLDALVAPIALYPDSLLTQIFVAATYPLDLMKADRFVDENAETPDEPRADLAEQEDWDPSVQVMAGGFPSVVSRMADEIDWTEELGDAVLVQTDDVLDAVQRMRSRAVATGYLTSNEAQVVEEDEESDAISIQPADPEVVYVPSYDSTAAFTTAPTAAPVVYATDEGWSAGEVLTTGAIAFGGAMILDEIFEDDDDDWDDYWRGPSNIDWDDGDFYPGRGVNVEGDVNIDRNREVNIDRDRNRVDVDRDRVNVDRDRVTGKIGSVDRDSIDIRKDGAFKPSDDRKKAARDKIEARKQSGGGSRESAKVAAAKDKMKAKPSGGEARAKLSEATAKREPKARQGDKVSALQPKAKDRPKAKDKKQVGQAKARADKSRAKSAAPPRPKATQAQPKKIAKGKKPKPSAKKAPKKSSALKQHSGGAKAKKGKSRGGKSSAKRKR